MKIPVFVSCPTSLNPVQTQCRKIIDEHLETFCLEPRAVGRSDYPVDSPLTEVLSLARHCSGGIILGFEQFRAHGGIWKPDTPEATPKDDLIPIPTPWNQLEAGILFTLKLPLLVFKEEGISGGIFDLGASNLFLHKMPSNLSEDQAAGLRDVFCKWQARVRSHYYSEGISA